MKILAGLLLAFIAGATQAHSVGTSYVWIEPASDAYATRIDMGLRDLEFALELDANGDAEITWGEVSARLPAIVDYVTRKLVVESAGQPCTHAQPRLSIDTHAGEPYASLALDTRCGGSGSLAVRSNLLFDIDDSHRTILTVIGDRASVSVLTAGTREWNSSVGSRATFLRFVGQGIWHIWIGFDHLAFLALLLLPLLRSEQTRREIVKQALYIVTAFTAAHSITLVCAAMGYIDLPSQWVEAGIAASIVIAAIFNVMSAPSRYGAAMAFGFGLIHGLGFASALADVLSDVLISTLSDSATSQRLLTLLAFNLGVEVGQVVIVAAVLPLLFTIRNAQGLKKRVALAGSLTMGAAGCVWLMQRTLFA